MLEKIYELYQNGKEMDSFLETKKCFEELKKIEGGKISDEMETVLNNYATQNEKQGFINGFRFAVKIMSECNTACEKNIFT